MEGPGTEVAAAAAAGVGGVWAARRAMGSGFFGRAGGGGIWLDSPLGAWMGSVEGATRLHLGSGQLKHRWGGGVRLWSQEGALPSQPPAALWWPSWPCPHTPSSARSSLPAPASGPLHLPPPWRSAPEIEPWCPGPCAGLKAEGMLPITCLLASLAAPQRETWGSCGCWSPAPPRGREQPRVSPKADPSGPSPGPSVFGWQSQRAPRPPSSPTPAASGSAQTPFVNVLASTWRPETRAGGWPRPPQPGGLREDPFSVAQRKLLPPPGQSTSDDAARAP